MPQLRDYPAKYIYEPWKAPIADQKKAKCVIGVDYPKPIVDHQVVSKENMNKMSKAYEAHKSAATGASGTSAAGSSSTATGGKRPLKQSTLLPSAKRTAS